MCSIGHADRDDVLDREPLCPVDSPLPLPARSESDRPDCPPEAIDPAVILPDPEDEEPDPPDDEPSIPDDPD